MPGRQSNRIARDMPSRKGGQPRRPLFAEPGAAAVASVFVPQGYEPAYAYPLVVWLPGGAAFDLGRVMARTSLRNFVAVQAAADATAGNAGCPEPSVWRAIDAARERFSIHPDRIYLVGQGSGGTAALRIACRHPDAFGGAVSLGGGFPLDEGAFARVREVRRLPMLLCCRRDADAATMPAVDRTLRLFHAAGAMLALRIYPGTSDLSRAILADVNRWIMEEICGPPAGHGERMTNEACGP
jgi:phospholipase/carboxylesterase